MTPVNSTVHLRYFVHLDMFNDYRSISEPLTSALLSAFSSMCSKYMAFLR
ncbi:rCG36593, partial [Rattus norvegicus]